MTSAGDGWGHTVCAACAGKAALHLQRYYSGTPERPGRMWEVLAPTYYLAGRPFCAAACVQSYRERQVIA